jgi:hypothetical protein
MRSLFKASLVAAAVVAAGTASAATLTNTTVSLSKQGAASIVAPTASGTITHTVEKGYNPGDFITFEMTPGSAASSTWPTTMDYTGCTVGPTTCGMVTSLFSVSPDFTKAVYRVNTVTADATAGETTTGASTDTSVSIKTSAISLGDVVLSVTSSTDAGIPFEDAETVILADSQDQFGDITVSTSLNQEISVESSRKEFVTGTTDTLVWEASNDTTLASAAVVDSTKVVVKGDFGTLPAEAFDSAIPTAVAVYDDAAKELTLTYSGVVTTDTITITPDTVATLARQDFTVEGEHTYATSLTEDLGSAAAGEWTLDGALVNIPYMPYGTNISQIIYVTNEGTLPGEISGTAFDENGMDYDLESLGTVGAGSVKKVTAQIKDRLEKLGFTSGKVSITLTVNAQDKDITVYAAYNVGGSDRGAVNTDSYKGIKN